MDEPHADTTARSRLFMLESREKYDDWRERMRIELVRLGLRGQFSGDSKCPEEITAGTRKVGGADVTTTVADVTARDLLRTTWTNERDKAYGTVMSWLGIGPRSEIAGALTETSTTHEVVTKLDKRYCGTNVAMR